MSMRDWFSHICVCSSNTWTESLFLGPSLTETGICKHANYSCGFDWWMLVLWVPPDVRSTSGSGGLEWIQNHKVNEVSSSSRRFCWNMKNIYVNLWIELRRDPLIESIGWWLQCVLLPMGMNVVYSHVQFRLRMNEIFKSKDCLIQSQNGTKGS